MQPSDSHGDLPSSRPSHGRKLSIFSDFQQISDYKLIRDSRTKSTLNLGGGVHRNRSRQTSESVYPEVDLLVNESDNNYKLKKHLLKTFHYVMRSSIYAKNRRKSLAPTFKADRRIWKPKELKAFYHLIKRNAINWILIDLVLQLTTILHKEKNREDVHLKDLPHQLFSWDRGHFLARRELSDFLYLDLLRRNSTEKQLLLLKTLKDRSEIIRFCTLIHKEYFSRQSNWKKRIQLALRDVIDLINMESMISSDYNEMKELQLLLKYKIADIVYRFYECYDAHRISILKADALDAKVKRSIEYRYETGMMAAEADVVIYGEKKKVKTLEDKINYYRELNKEDETCHVLQMNAIRLFEDKYLKQLHFWTQKYDREVDLAEEELLILGFRINQLETEYNRIQSLLQRCRTYRRRKGRMLLESPSLDATKTPFQLLVEDERHGVPLKLAMLKLHERVKKMLK